jgi:uncharacterized protein
LGTLLLPVFAVFFPLDLAVLLTAVVHLLNNVFKFGLLKEHVRWSVLLRLGVPGIAGALVGAMILRQLGKAAPLYEVAGNAVEPLDLVIAFLMLAFGLLELSERLNKISLKPKWMVPGGLLSGFFGGLSGHQGALRSLFLLRAGLSKQELIGTGIAIALLVDLTRIPVYLSSGLLHQLPGQWLLLTLTTLSAFVGAWWGTKLIPKVTYRGVQIAVGVMMLVIAVLLTAGVV